MGGLTGVFDIQTEGFNSSVTSTGQLPPVNAPHPPNYLTNNTSRPTLQPPPPPSPALTHTHVGAHSTQLVLEKGSC